MGCCRTRPKTVDNDDISITKHHTTLAPPTRAYQLNYVPPTHNQTALQNNPVTNKYQYAIPISPASTGALLYNSNQNSIDAQKNAKSNVMNPGIELNSNTFRQSQVPMPNTMPIMVELKDLQALKRF